MPTKQTQFPVIIDVENYDPDLIADQVQGWGFKIEEITPAKAKRYLAKNNKGNRNQSKVHTTRYATDIKTNNWDPYNGEFLKTSNDGVLRDGQNRLQAIVDTDQPQIMVHITGLDPKAQNTMDHGRTRSDAHILQIAGEPDATSKGSIGRVICQMDVVHQQTINRLPQASWHVPAGEPARRVLNDPEVQRACQYAIDNAEFVPLSKASLGGFYYALHRYGNTTAADTFLAAFRDATGPADSPPRVLRDRLLRAQTGPKQSRLHRDETLALAISAYNRWLANETLTRVRIAKRFPRVKSGPKKP